jgi:Na(+)-translocating NADH:ubiquinone oxidoreductase A subunit
MTMSQLKRMMTERIFCLFIFFLQRESQTVLQKRQSFKGGYNFKRLVGTPRTCLREIGIPEQVIIPLKQGFSEEVPPIVKHGDKVKAGQIIGIDDNLRSSPVHATVNGTVKDLCLIRHWDGNTLGIVIEPDGTPDWVINEHLSSDIEKADPDQIRKILYLSGVSSSGKYGFPTKYNTSSLFTDEVENLIINAVNTEPYCLRNDTFLSGNIDKFLTGIDILRRSLNDKIEVYLGIDCNDKDIIEQIKLSDSRWLNIHPLKPKYPQDHDVILTETILGKKVPYGGSIQDIKTVVVDVQDVIHAYEAVIEGKSVIDRAVALGGSLSEVGFVKVRIGTQLKHIISTQPNKRVIYGGIITGVKCDDLSIPIDRTTTSISVLEENQSRQFLFFIRSGINRGSFSNSFLSSFFPTVERKTDTNLNGELRPCIYCNYCESVCPVDLMPYLISKYITHDMIEEAEKYNPLSCIDCGLCTFVCPSKIPVMSHIQDAKAKIRKEEY